MRSSSPFRYALVACAALVGAHACTKVAVYDAVPPPPSDAATATTSLVETFAIDAIFAGESDRDGGAPSNQAWEQYGYDLDGVITTADASNVCNLAPDAARWAQVDGLGGVDNAWGAAYLPLLETSASYPTPSALLTSIIRAGAWTLQIQTTGLPVDGTATSGITAQVFTSTTYDQGTPTFDSTTDWPVATDSLSDHTTLGGGAAVQFHDSYVASNGLFVSGTPSSSQVLLVPVHVGGTATLLLTIHHVIITFARSGARLVNGTIAGVIETSELIAEQRKNAASFNSNFCGTDFNGVAEQIAEVQDILADGTNAPGVPCNAISIGVGFTARQIANPTKVSSTPLDIADPCDASTD